MVGNLQSRPMPSAISAHAFLAKERVLTVRDRVRPFRRYPTPTPASVILTLSLLYIFTFRYYQYISPKAKSELPSMCA